MLETGRVCLSSAYLQLINCRFVCCAYVLFVLFLWLRCTATFSKTREGRTRKTLDKHGNNINANVHQWWKEREKKMFIVVQQQRRQVNTWGGWTNERMEEWMYEWTIEWMDELKNGCVVFMDKRMAGWKSEWMKGWIDDWTKVHMNEIMNEWKTEWLGEWLEEIM